MSLSGRDRAILHEIALLMLGEGHGGPPNWRETQQGITYWDEVYRNLLSLANPPEEDGTLRLAYVTTFSGRHFCTAPTDESHECQRETLSMILNENAFETPSDILEVEYLLGWEVD